MEVEDYHRVGLRRKTGTVRTVVNGCGRLSFLRGDRASAGFVFSQ